MKNSLVTVFVGLSMGVSCSLNSRVNSGEEKVLIRKPITGPDRDDGEISEKGKTSPQKQTRRGDLHPMNVSREKKTFTEIQNSGHSKKRSGEKIPGKKTTQDVIKIVKVNGMVCAFCSNSIEKKFKKQEAVRSVQVDLESKMVTIVLKPRGELSNNQIKSIITASGFHVVSIEDRGTEREQEIVKDEK